MHATWPLAKLAVLPEGIWIGPSKPFLKFLVPHFVFPWNDVDRMEALGDREVRIFLRSVGASVVFGSWYDRDRILQLAEQHDAAVDYRSHKTGWWSLH